MPDESTWVPLNIKPGISLPHRVKIPAKLAGQMGISRTLVIASQTDTVAPDVKQWLLDKYPELFKSGETVQEPEPEPEPKKSSSSSTKKKAKKSEEVATDASSDDS